MTSTASDIMLAWRSSLWRVAWDYTKNGRKPGCGKLIRLWADDNRHYVGFQWHEHCQLSTRTLTGVQIPSTCSVYKCLSLNACRLSVVFLETPYSPPPSPFPSGNRLHLFTERDIRSSWAEALHDARPDGILQVHRWTCIPHLPLWGHAKLNDCIQGVSHLSFIKLDVSTCNR